MSKRLWNAKTAARSQIWVIEPVKSEFVTGRKEDDRSLQQYSLYCEGVWIRETLARSCLDI
jgi:hypothetical protein